MELTCDWETGYPFYIQHSHLFTFIFLNLNLCILCLRSIAVALVFFWSLPIYKAFLWRVKSFTQASKYVVLEDMWHKIKVFHQAYHICMYIFQMKAQDVSISEDGREYDLIVESTVPLPCSSQRCTLPLHLTSSNQGGVENNIIKKINVILPYIFRPSESYSHCCMCKYDNIYSIFSTTVCFCLL